MKKRDWILGAVNDNVIRYNNKFGTLNQMMVWL